VRARLQVPQQGGQHTLGPLEGIQVLALTGAAASTTAGGVETLAARQRTEGSGQRAAGGPGG
jgi:hypothetical protein